MPGDVPIPPLGVAPEPLNEVFQRAMMEQLQRELQHYHDAEHQRQQYYMGAQQAMNLGVQQARLAGLQGAGGDLGQMGFTGGLQGTAGGLAGALGTMTDGLGQWTNATGTNTLTVGGMQAALAALGAPALIRPDPKVLARALGLLEAKIGAEALAKIQNGGAYPIKSAWWQDVVYLVPRDPHERVKVVQEGSVVTEVCIVTTDASLPWPDILLQRITAIQMDESIVFAKGVIHDRRPVSWAAKVRALFRRDAVPVPVPG